MDNLPLRFPLLKTIFRKCVYIIYHTLSSMFMQELQSVFKIEEDITKDAILSVVSDKYCRSIIKTILTVPKSALEISTETQIPISTVYRRIQTLHDNKLLQTSGMLNEDGKKFFLYKSKIKEIRSQFNNGQMNVELIFNQ